MLDRYWWHYRNWSLPWVRCRSLPWWPHRYASWLHCGERYDIFHGCSPWRNDNAFSCHWFICGLLVEYIESELESHFRVIMPLDGLTRLLVSLSVTTTGTCTLSLYRQKSQRCQS